MIAANRQLEGEAMLRAFADGDGSGMAAFIASFRSAVLAEFKRHRMRWHEIDDCENTVWFKVWRYAGRYDAARSSVHTWIAMIAHAVAVDALRHRIRRRRLSGREGPEYLDALARGYDEDARMDAAARLREIKHEALQLVGRGVTNEGIARVLGRPVNTVKSDIHRARARLGTGKVA